MHPQSLLACLILDDIMLALWPPVVLKNGAVIFPHAN